MKLHRFNLCPGETMGAPYDALAVAVDRLAKPGAPYCHSHIALLLAKQGYPTNPLETLMKTAALVCDELVACYGWARHPAFPFFAKGTERTTMPLVLTYAVPPGIGQNAIALARIIQILTGDEPVLGTVRRTMTRLIEQRVYARVEEGLYANIHTGD